jgi:hypothetical protein
LDEEGFGLDVYSCRSIDSSLLSIFFHFFIDRLFLFLFYRFGAILSRLMKRKHRRDIQDDQEDALVPHSAQELQTAKGTILWPDGTSQNTKIDNRNRPI